MSRTITIAGDVEDTLEKYRPEVAKTLGKQKPSYSDILRFILKSLPSKPN